MKPEFTIMKQIIHEALATAQQLRAEHIPPAIASKTQTMRRMAEIRNRAILSNSDLREHADMDSIHAIESALGEIQSDIEAAIVDMNHAKTPEQRRKADERLAKLTEQRNKLLQQLEQAKIRQINRAKRKL